MLAEKPLDLETGELVTKWAIGMSRHCLTIETVCKTLVDTLVDTLPDVEAKTLFDTLASTLEEAEDRILVNILRERQRYRLKLLLTH